MCLIIPSAEILSSVEEFNKKSNSATVLFLLTQVPDEIQIKIFPLRLEAEFIGINEKLEKEVMVYLVKVRESIEKYYAK
jgi:hypothetical protein